MWNTFPSKHTTYFFHICERVHLGILFMLTKTTKRLITIFEITIRKWNCVGIEYNRIIELISHWFKNSLFEIFLFPPQIEMNFHNLFCSKKSTQSASTLAVCLLENFDLFMSMQMLINTPPESTHLGQCSKNKTMAMK